MYSLRSDQKPSKQIAEESVADSEGMLIQHRKYNMKKYNTHVLHYALCRVCKI